MIWSDFIHFQYDGRGEYFSHELIDYLCEHEITLKVSCLYTLEQNGVAKCRHHHIIESVINTIHDSEILIAP